MFTETHFFHTCGPLSAKCLLYHCTA